MTPTVTAVLPTFQRPEMLRLALRSVQDQVRPPDRIVVVDVGATSWSESAAARYSDESGIATDYLAVPSGRMAGAARNAGGATVRTGWIAFLDDDDVWLPRYLEEAITGGRPHTDMVATRIRLRRGDATFDFPPLSPALQASDVLAENPGITGSSLIVDAAAFHQVGGYDEELAAFNDLDFLIRALDAGLTLTVNNSVLVEQRLHTVAHATTASTRRLAALDTFADRYASRMSAGQRRRLGRDRHRILKHISPSPAARTAHLLADIAMTGPADLVRRAQRRARLGGGYD